MFQILFLAVTFVLTLTLAVLIAYALWQSIENTVDAKAIIAFAGAAASGVATGFVVKRAVESIKVARVALQDVNKYCGAHVRQQLT